MFVATGRCIAAMSQTDRADPSGDVPEGRTTTSNERDVDREIHSTITGSGTAELAWCGVEHREEEGGEFQYVRATFDLYDLEVQFDFTIEQAERFLVEFRDELVRAKQAQLEWQTETDPETGIAEDSTA